MTPEAVIYRYLECAAEVPRDPARLARLIGTDADLLGRWLRLLGCPAEPQRLAAALEAMDEGRLRDLAAGQAWAVLAVSGTARMAFDQWLGVAHAATLAEVLAEELGLADPGAVRWRVLLASSGVSLPHDPLMVDLLAFRGARPELLEDASVIHRLLAVVEALDVTDAVALQEMVSDLLDIDPGRFQTIQALADQRSDHLLRDLGLDVDGDTDWAERLWLRLQMGILGHLFEQDGSERDANALLSRRHALVSRSLFGSVPWLMRLNPDSGVLESPAAEGPRIRLDSATSTIARSVRLGERSEFVDRTDQAVADRQVLRLLGAEDAICHPLLDPGGGPALGVLVFAVDEEVDQEAAMVLYAEELARHLRRGPTVTPGTELLRRYRQREEKRLRELVHEANNPLAVVNNYLHILQTRLEADPETVSQLRLIAGELGRTGNLLAQVRDMSPLEDTTAEPRLEIVDVDLNDLAGRVVELHRGYAADQDVALAYSLAPGPLVVRSDPSRLTQILNNLVRNAIEAAGGRSVTVGSTGGVFREGREGAVVTVRDTGPGLPREVLLHLAEPKQSSKPGDHAGLGLHIVHRLVAELEGSIDVQTGSGQGTTFSVFLPLSPA